MNSKKEIKYKKSIAAIVLAAGKSSRLGRPKQLISFNDKTLIENAIYQLKEAGVTKIFVVLGAYERECRLALQNWDVETISNPIWSEGIGSSIKAALMKIQKSKENFDGILLSLCDQPLIESDHYIKMITSFENSATDLVATKYDETTGVPGLFSKKIFSKLEHLKNADGAKQVIESIKNTILIPSTVAQFDVDTVEDILALRRYEQEMDHQSN